MKACTDAFKFFYQGKHTNRRLEWQYQNGTCEMVMLAAEKPYQLVVNVFQATICSLFNEKQTWTYEELMNKTQIPKQQFNGGLLMLCNPKFKVLEKAVKKPTFTPNETIKYNTNFKHKNIRVNVLPIPSKEEKKVKRETDQKDNMEGIIRERGQIIDAHTVKQMKTNKTMMYQTLMTKVMESVNTFKAQPEMIKQRIQHLIEQDYMERDKENRAKLIYIP